MIGDFDTALSGLIDTVMDAQDALDEGDLHLVRERLGQLQADLEAHLPEEVGR